jgi:hypothetical protein
VHRQAAHLLGALLAVGLTLAPLPRAADAEVPEPGDAPSIELVSQTPVVVAGESFVANVLLDGVPAEGSIAIDLHQRIRSRSELAQSMDGEGLRGRVFQTVTPLSDLPPQPDGTRRVVLTVDPSTAEGVYPLELTAQDAGGAPLATLVTHLIVPPEEGDDAPNLAVAVVGELGAPIALQPDGSVDLPRNDVAALASLVAGFTAAPNVPASLSVDPETVEALLASPETADPGLVTAMKAAAAGRTVLADPYVPLDLDRLADAGLLSEVDHQQARGLAVLSRELGVTPDGGARIAPPTLGADGLAVLAFTGTSRVVVDDANVEPFPDGVISYSLAQPFVVAVPEDADVEDRTPGNVLGLAPDPIVMERLHGEGSPGLVVSRVLAELALLRLEQPSVARSSVIPLTPGLDAATVQLLLKGIGAGRPFEAVPLASAFEHAAPVQDGGGNQVDRALRPAPSEPIPAGTARAVLDRRADIETFRTLVGPDSPLPELPSRHLLVATAADLSDGERRAHLDAAAAEMESVAGEVTTPPTFTLTLTAREGTIPLTIRNGADAPLHVSVHLNSQKLDFPDGDTVDLDLPEGSTRLDIRVRARTSGAFPLRIDIRTPDGQQSLAMSRYTVRSTAVSGVGLLLSIGAGVFLTVWWARHWHRTRRSKKLFGANGHTSAAGH